MAKKKKVLKKKIQAKKKSSIKAKATTKRVVAKTKPKPKAKAKAKNIAAIVKSSQLSSSAKALAKVSEPVLNWFKSFTPLDDRVLLKPKAKNEMRTAGGLYIPETAVAEKAYVEAQVLRIGRGHMNKKGHIRPFDLAVGDLVLIEAHSGSSFEDGNEKYTVTRESEILGLVNK